MEQNEKPWNEKLMEVLRQTGESIRNEAQSLVGELSDPQNHEKVKQGLQDLGDWAKRTAEEAATMVDQAAQKVEATVQEAVKRAKKAAAKTQRKVAGAKKKKKAKGSRGRKK